MRTGKFILLLLSAAPASAAEPGWKVGWGFESHGGFPSLPAHWRSYAMRDSVAGYFLGNASGLDSPDELAAEDRFRVVGIGWQLDNIPSHYSHLEQYEIAEATALKALRPDAKVMVLRNTEVATVFWDSAKAKMFDNTTQSWWTQCGDKPCQGVWSSPAGNTPKYFFNFSNPDLAQWWVEDFVGGVLDNDLFDGVYFDCSCGAPPGDHLDQQRMQADAQVAFDQALARIAAAGKWASAWNSDGAITKAGDACSSSVRTWIEKGANPNVTLQVLAPSFKHLPPASAPPTTMAGNNTVAAFLIARGASAMLELPVKGAYGLADTYGWSPLFDADFGEPDGPGREIISGVFTREWSKATVTLDCNTFTSNFIFSSPSKPR